MKKSVVLFGLIAGLFFAAAAANAQTPTVITFAKGASKKTLPITVKAKGANKYAVTVKKGQVVNVVVSGNIGISKTNDFPVISVNMDYKDGVDRTQDGEAYYSLLAGRNGRYIITIASGAKESRSFNLEVEVSDNKEDFQGGEVVDQ